MRIERRRFLERAAGVSVAASAASLLPTRAVLAVSDAPLAVPFGDGEFLSLSDGHLTLPVDFVMPDSIGAAERSAFLAEHGLGPDTLTPDCNVTLWRTPERLVLFDVGAGTQFMPGAGLLPESLAAAGVDPLEVTDVVLTHAHPDHLWGVLDDFDELAFPEAAYHVHRDERDYWLASGTLANTPDASKPFVVGAQNRLPLLDERLVPFDWGDEILPGVEAVDTHGHTPGHSSFALHAGSDSVLVLGDALTNAAISFARPAWPSGTDQDPDKAIRTRLALLERLAGENAAVLGFHLPAPGLGRVERDGASERDPVYRFVSDG